MSDQSSIPDPDPDVREELVHPETVQTRADHSVTRPRSTPLWRGCLVTLGLAALAVVAIGYHDSVTAERLAARVTGAALLVVGLMAIVGIAIAWSDRDRSWRAGGVAALALFLISLWILSAVMRPWPRPPLLGIAISSALIAVVAILTMNLAWRRREPGTDTDPDRGGHDRAAWIGASATIAAALVALPLAWYSAHYLPTHTAPSVSVRTELKDVGERNGQGVASIVITVEDTGRTSARLIGSMYTLAGSAIVPAQPSGPELNADRVEAVTRDNYGPAARYSAQTELMPPELIQFGQVVWDQATLDSGESTEASVVAFFPMGKFDILRLGVDLVLGRDDRLPVAEPNFSGTPDGSAECSSGDIAVRSWPLVPGSTVEMLTTADREVVLGRVIHDEDGDETWWPAAPYLRYQVQHTDNSCDHLFDSRGGLEDESMMAVAGAMTEEPVPTELAPPGS